MGIVLSLMLAVLLSGCNYYEAKGLAIGPGDTELVAEEPTYETLSKAFFTPYCIRCHSGAEPAGGADLTTYAGMEDIYFVAGDPESSLVYTLTRDGYMPHRGPRPAAELIETVRKWIADGAKEK
jgi:hypothetical protein